MISKILTPVTLDRTKSRITQVDFLLVLLCLSVGWSEIPPNQSSSTDPTPVNPASAAFDPRYEIPGDSLTLQPDKQTSRKAYFGDLHVHTAYYLDASAYGTLATLGDAYRYARGEKIRHSGGFDVQLRQPLNFYAVTDHAIFRGTLNAISNGSSKLASYEPYLKLNDINAPETMSLDSLDLRSTVMRGHKVQY